MRLLVHDKKEMKEIKEDGGGFMAAQQPGSAADLDAAGQSGEA